METNILKENESMYTYAKLENASVQMLYQTYTDAFSDYQINLNISVEEFEIMLQRRGFVREISVGAFKKPNDELVGLMLSGLRNWQGKLTAYDLMTGVTPSNRKQGITSHMFKHVLTALAQNNVEQYLLEVLQDNTNAFELYKKQGFRIVRNFSCFNLNKNIYHPQVRSHKVEYVTDIKLNEWEQFKLFWDVHPSWQNSIESISAVSGVFIYSVVYLDGKLVGYGIVGKQTGDVPQIAVHRAYRHKGIAKSIVSSLLDATEANGLHILNVDNDCMEMRIFLNKLGCKLICSQYEMSLPLVSK